MAVVLKWMLSAASSISLFHSPVIGEAETPEDFQDLPTRMGVRGRATQTLSNPDGTSKSNGELL